VPAEPSPTGLAEKAWWTRVRRAAERKGPIGSKVMSAWGYEMISILAVGPDNNLELVAGAGWQPIPPERFTDEYKQRETRRLCDELGRTLGVGPMPMP
jgi:hypothetical protein